MSKRNFFKPPTGLTVGEIAALTGAEPRAGARLDHLITNVASLEMAGPDDLTFFAHVKYSDILTSTHAGACLMAKHHEERAAPGLTVLCTGDPFRAFVAVARKLFPDSLRPSSVFDTAGIFPNATIHSSARLESGVIVDPGAVVGPGARIGAGTVIGATAVIGPRVHIGRHCSIGPGVSILHALIGDDVIIHPGCRIGQDGFRFQMSAKGHTKVPQLGRVIIQDHVEIGANTTIDRGTSADTVIGEGVKIDNLVQIGHNVIVGRNSIIVGQCGLSGSVVLGDNVVLGGQVGVVDHLTIGEGARIAAKSGVLSNVPAGETWMGYPALRGKQFIRNALRKPDGKRN